MLDMVGALLADGKGVHEVPTDPKRETDLTQVFLTFDLEQLHPADRAEQIANDIIDHLHSAPTAGDAEGVYYPGERTLERRGDNQKHGIPVDEGIWEKVQSL